MPRLLVQLSDPHIKAPGSLAYGRVDTAAMLSRAVDSVRRLAQAPDAVVVTGDLTDFGRADEYAHLQTLLRPLACPVYLLPGNHDDRRALRAAFPDHAYLHAGGSEFIQYAVALAGLRLVVVDTVVAGAGHGALCAERLAHLEALLEEDRDTPTIVAMHHPPFQTFIGHMDELGLIDGADALEALIARHANVERVICGHLHRSIQVCWANTLALTAPSTAHQVCLDLASDAASAFTMEPPGFLIHAWADGGSVVTHQASIGVFDGPYPFFDADGLID
jgi:3',5'-cyclic AMP phosphodiesterase CpdA